MFVYVVYVWIYTDVYIFFIVVFLIDEKYKHERMHVTKKRNENAC